MSSSRFPEHDEQVRAWFAEHDWSVDATNEEMLNIYEWRHEGTRPALSVDISLDVLTRYEPTQLRAAFDRLGVAEALRSSPTGRVALRDVGGAIAIAPTRAR